MTIPKQKFREIILQLLYASNIPDEDRKESLDLLMKELNITKKNMIEAETRLNAILECRDELDKLISQVSNSYDFDRIQRVEKNILRMGVYELIYDQEIPQKVAISEAMRLCRKFSTPEAARFVNGILDALHQEKKEQAS